MLNGPNLNLKSCLILLSSIDGRWFCGTGVIGAEATGATETGAGPWGWTSTPPGPLGATGSTADGAVCGRSADHGASPGAKHVRT
jgi:hypothetical protein